LLHFRQAALGGGGFQPCYTVEIDDFRLSSSKLRDVCLRIASADGMHFTKGYVAFGLNALARVAFDQSGAYTAGLSFLNTYFDCANNVTGTPNAIEIPADSLSSSNVFDFKIGSGCTIGNGSGYGIICLKPEVMALSINDARILNMKAAAVTVENASGDSLDFQMTGCHLQNCGSVSTSVVRLKNGRSFALSNNIFADNVNVQVTVAGNWRTGSVTGNVNAQSTVADFARSGATFLSPLVIAGNSSRRALAANSWIGNQIGNVRSDDALALDWYQEGTFTPTISFGGASVDVTYGTQTGTFTRIGNQVFYSIRLMLTSKGSSTGEARIGALPFGVFNSAVTHPSSVRMNNMANSFGQNSVVADVLGSTGNADIRLISINPAFGTQIVATDVEFTNTTNIIINGTYQAS
jgi:hypothetical protein